MSYNDNRLQNPLTYKQGMTFTWQNGRQMAGAVRNGKTLTFKYNDDGIRTEKYSEYEAGANLITNTTKFYLDGSTILAQETVSSTGTTTRFDFFYDDKGDVIGFKYNGANYFYIKNLQGDITDIVDSTGTVVVSYTYDTWGVVKSTTGTMKSTIGNKNPFRYRSYYYDTDLALYYLNSRYYDPDTGRFINADSILDNRGVNTQNLFAYCGNNPVNNIDMDGHLFGAIITGVVIGVGCVLLLTGCSSESTEPSQSTITTATTTAPTTITTTEPIISDIEKSYAATVYAEAGGQNITSKRAVAHVMNNRIGKRSTWTNIEEVISAPYQFDGYNSPMYCEAMDYYNTGVCDNLTKQTAMDECLDVVIPIYGGFELDITGGAIYFHSYKNPNDWAYHDDYTLVSVAGTEKFWFYKE